ncbi:MAG: YiiX/YebB-like N1pC/P60 family cysteine hydrolase [Pseudobdellovibrio sp.]
MKKYLLKITIAIGLCLTTQTAMAQNTRLFADGDIIFHKSKSQQSAALREATGSEWTHVGILLKNKTDGAWYVAEAIGPVKATPLKDFIARGQKKEYRVYRNTFFNPKTMKDKLISAIQKHNKPYDIYFEFTDEKTYCSELVYKAFYEVIGKNIGTVQKMKEMRLDGPYVKALIKKRLTDTGRKLNPEEPIITPVSQMIDKNLKLIAVGAAQ